MKGSRCAPATSVEAGAILVKVTLEARLYSIPNARNLFWSALYPADFVVVKLDFLAFMLESAHLRNGWTLL